LESQYNKGLSIKVKVNKLKMLFTNSL